MNKSILWLIGLLFVTSFAITSCSETDGEIDPYANWAERNQKYIDSIAGVAKANPSEWKVIHTYKFTPPMNVPGDVNDYVYCKVIKSGNGATPLFTDSVAVNYRGELIPLLNGETVIFDQSYTGELNPQVATPVGFRVGEVITGWTTALQQMKVGDRWMLYIPSDLGYGVSGKNSIPGYSTLIFDVDLVNVFPLEDKIKTVVKE